MCCRDNAYIDVNVLLSANAFDLMFLQHSQQSNLRCQRQLAYFIEKERATIRSFKPPSALIGCAGEAASFVTKQLGVDQFGWYGTTVDANSRLAAVVRSLARK
jgi:hypothetical protein